MAAILFGDERRRSNGEARSLAKFSVSLGQGRAVKEMSLLKVFLVDCYHYSSGWCLQVYVIGFAYLITWQTFGREK
jgi:hypothetical protein